MAEKRKTYPADFKKKIVSLYKKDGYTAKRLCTEFDVSPSSIRNWVLHAEETGANLLSASETRLKKAQEVFQLKISLQYSHPKIWRRVLVPAEMSFLNLHEVIQDSFGWQDYHLFQFVKGNCFICVPQEDDLFEGQNEEIDAKKTKIRDWFLTYGKMTYEYDFGDNWTHSIVLEKSFSRKPNVKYPVCIAGKRACPPEDVGGIGGYSNLLDIMSNPTNEEYEEMCEWATGDPSKPFDPEYFCIEDVNTYLREWNWSTKHFKR